MTVKELATHLDLSPHTIRNYIRQGKIKADKVKNALSETYTYSVSKEEVERITKLIKPK